MCAPSLSLSHSFAFFVKGEVRLKEGVWCLVVWFVVGGDIKGYLCSLVLLFQFSYLFLVLQSRAGLLETGSAVRCLSFDYLVRHVCVGLGFGIVCLSFGVIVVLWQCGW
jgi:hypothetical protein